MPSPAPEGPAKGSGPGAHGGRRPGGRAGDGGGSRPASPHRPTPADKEAAAPAALPAVAPERPADPGAAPAPRTPHARGGPGAATHPQGGEVDVHQTFCRRVVRHFPFLPPKAAVTTKRAAALLGAVSGKAADGASSHGDRAVRTPPGETGDGGGRLSAGPGRARRSDGACAGRRRRRSHHGAGRPSGPRASPAASGPGARAPRRAPRGRARSVGPRRRRELSE